MPSSKSLFFECFLACRSGPETRNSHHILTIYPTCTLPKHAWNTILSTKSLLFARFGIPKSAWNAKLSSNSHMLSRLRPAKTALKHNAVDPKQRVFIVFDRSKSAWNVKLSSNSAIVSISQPLKTGLKHDAVVKTCVFWYFFLLVQSGLKHEALIQKCRFSAPQSSMRAAFLNSAG